MLNLGKAGQLLAVEVAERTVVGRGTLRSLDTALLFASSVFVCALVEEVLVSRVTRDNSWCSSHRVPSPPTPRHR